MAEVSTSLIEMVLRDVAASGAEPWYPAAYAQATGVARHAIDAGLDHLRLASLVRLTDWVQGRGQGYTLTPLGAEVLDNPRLLARLREGKDLSRRPAAPEAGPPSLRGTETAWDRGEAIRTALLNPPRPVVTQTLLFLNIAVFVYGFFLASQQGVGGAYFGMDGDARVMQIRAETGLLRIDYLLDGQWWRLLSYSFVHIGVIHLAMNMFVLYSLGAVAETLWGSWRYLAIYLISGLGGGVAQILVEPSVLMGGASGCLCGLLGTMAVWVTMNKTYLPPRLASEWMRNIMTNVFLIVFISLLPRVSWAGHLGGAVAGVLASVPMNYNRFGRGAQRWLGALGVAAVPVLAIGLLWLSLPEQVAADTPDVETFRKKYATLLWKTNGTIDQVYREHGRSYLGGDRKPADDPQAAREAAAAFQKASTRLQGYADSLRKAGPFSSRTVRKFTQVAVEYARVGSLFAEEFAAALDPPERWTRERAGALQMRLERLDELSDQLRASQVYGLVRK